MTAKARYFQNDEGAVYTSLRPEAAVITEKAIETGLLKHLEGMLERLTCTKNLSLEKNSEALAAG